MLTGAVEIYANHPFVIVGSTAWPKLVWDNGPASADARHVAIRTRGQEAHTRVSFWWRTMPLVGTVVFDGELDLEDYRIYAGDIERLGRWTQRIERTGVQRVIVMVDDPGYASRVHVGLGIGTDTRPVPTTGKPALFNVLTAEAEGFPGPAELGLVLDGHDSPHARLTAAIRLLPGPEPYEAGIIAEWIRWLGIELTDARASELSLELVQLVHAARATGTKDEDASRIASTILAAVVQENCARD